MEKLKGKHNHTLTNILKVFTFALVLLFPFLVFMPTAFYYGFNEHAQIEIPQEIAKYETNELTQIQDIVNGNIYKINMQDSSKKENFELFLSYSGGMYITYIAYEDKNYQDFIQFTDDNNADYIFLVYNTDNQKIEVSNDSDWPVITISAQSLYIVSPYWTDFTTDLIDCHVDITKSDYNVYEITETTTISENLSNSWENMWETPLFAWTNNTPFTATTNAFASVFNISQQSGIYNLLAYFITITGIYLVIDIVIGVATMLTHMISKQD